MASGHGIRWKIDKVLVVTLDCRFMNYKFHWPLVISANGPIRYHIILSLPLWLLLPLLKETKVVCLKTYSFLIHRILDN